jgi:hypothetical protein
LRQTKKIRLVVWWGNVLEISQLEERQEDEMITLRCISGHADQEGALLQTVWTCKFVPWNGTFLHPVFRNTSIKIEYGRKCLFLILFHLLLLFV